MPLVKLQVRFDHRGVRWCRVWNIPVVLRVSTLDDEELPGSPVKIDRLKAFDEFLECSSDSSFHERTVLVNALIDNDHAEISGLYFETLTLQRLLGGKFEILSLHPGKRRTGWLS